MRYFNMDWRNQHLLNRSNEICVCVDGIFYQVIFKIKNRVMSPSNRHEHFYEAMSDFRNTNSKIMVSGRTQFYYA